MILTKRDIIKGVIGNKSMAVIEVADFCQDYGLLPRRIAKDTMASMIRDGWFTKVGEKPNPSPHNRGYPTLDIYKYQDKRDAFIGRADRNQGLARKRLSNEFRQKLIVKHMPQMMLFSKELGLSEELL